jgi:hypothetical protein
VDEAAEGWWRVTRCGTAVIVVGVEPPAMSVSYVRPTSRYDSGFAVIFSEYDLELAEDDPAQPSSTIVCLHCLVHAGDEQLGRGLDLARVHGQVDYDPELGEWFVPPDAGWTKDWGG